MKRFSITMAALFMGLVLSSCASSVGTLKGQYPAINTVTTNSSFEDVWSRVIDFLLKIIYQLVLLQRIVVLLRQQIFVWVIHSFLMRIKMDKS